MATGTSNMLFPGHFTGSINLETYMTLFEFLAHLQKRKRNETCKRTEVQIDERPQPHHLALGHKESTIGFCRILRDPQKASYEETVLSSMALYTENSIVFCGRLGRRMQHLGKI